MYTSKLNTSQRTYWCVTDLNVASVNGIPSKENSNYLVVSTEMNLEKSLNRTFSKCTTVAKSTFLTITPYYHENPIYILWEIC